MVMHSNFIDTVCYTDKLSSIPAITVPGRMRYSRHKRSGISYGCHNESPGLLLAAISDLASLQVIPSVGFTPPARIVSSAFEE